MVGKSRESFKEGIREEPWGERYFPGLTEYEPGEIAAAPNGPLEIVARKVRKYPWKCMGIAAGVGALVGFAVGITAGGAQSQD